MRLRKITAQLASVLCVLFSFDAHAMVLSMTFDASVVNIFDFDDPTNPLPPEIGAADIFVGTSFTGTIAVDLSIEDTNPDADRGLFPSSVSGSFQLGGVSGTLFDSATNSAFTTNDNTFFGDSFAVVSEATVDFAANELAAWGLQLVDATGQALDSDALPTALPRLSQFDPFLPDEGVRTLVFALLTIGDTDIVIEGELNNVASTVVPLPATLPLIVSAFVGMVALRRNAGRSK